jgi:DinB family protein
VTRPDKSEHHQYYSTYIDQVPDGDILAILRTGIDETAALLSNHPTSIADHRYAPGKWTVREVINHLVDSERTFGFRAFWFARKGAGELPSFDQEPFVVEARINARSLDSLLAEWRTVRASNLSLFETIDDEASTRTGIASGNRFTVRSFPWIIAGHEIHHRKQLNDRYLARA